jgi:hypothetical protein
MPRQLLFAARFSKLRLAIAALSYLGIVIGGSIPGVRADMAHVASGLVLHGLAYSCLCFLLFSGSSGSRNRRALLAVLGVMLMGALDEYVQSFFPYRHAAVGDWLVDCSAAVAMAILLWGSWPSIRTD